MAGTAVPGPSGDDWAAHTADTIERLVGRVRAKTTQPVEGIARWLVYGLLAAIVGLMAFVVLVLMVFRILVVVLPGGAWLPDLLLGGIFVVAGAFLWSRRTRRPAA